MKAKWLFLIVAFPLCAELSADTITLKNGSHVEGAVVAFKNQKFEFESDKGSKDAYAPSELERIDFKGEGEENGVAVEIIHRVNGAVKGRVSEFAAGNFKLVDKDGKEQSLPVLMVTSASFAGGKVNEIEIITHGKGIDIEKKLAAGKVTLVDFYADWCGPCRMISPHLEDLVKKDKGIVLRKVDIVRWNTEIRSEE